MASCNIANEITNPKTSGIVFSRNKPIPEFRHRSERRLFRSALSDVESLRDATAREWPLALALEWHLSAQVTNPSLYRARPRGTHAPNPASRDRSPRDSPAQPTSYHHHRNQGADSTTRGDNSVGVCETRS